MPENVEKVEKPAPYVHPSQRPTEDLIKQFQEEMGITPPPAEPPVEAGKPATEVVAKPPAAVEKADDTPALVKIAKAKDALRKEREQVAPHLDMLKAFSPTEAQRMAQARAAGNPVALLAAAGFTHAQYNAAVAGLKDEPEATEKPTGNPEYDSLKQELAALKAERDNERIQSSRSQFLSHTEKLLKDDPKYAHLSSLGEWQSVEAVILAHIREHGEPPGSTLDESIQLAAEQVEYNLKKEAERWSGVLTKLRPGAVVAQKAPESPRPASESPRTLTNANTTAPAAVRTTPKSRDEIIAAIARGEDIDDSTL